MKPYLIVIPAILLIIVYSFYRIGYFNPIVFKGEGFYVGNFHTHTIASDGVLDYNQLIDEAVSLNFSFIAITDHQVISLPVALLCNNDRRILCVIGEEVSSLDGHVLAIGISSVIPKGLSANETIKLIHDQDGLAIPAHPEDELGIKRELLTLDWDAIECNSAIKPEDQFYGCNNSYPKVYDSDAHDALMLKASASKCYLSNLSLSALKASVKAGNCTLNNIN